jgi:transporter family-2 protein
MEEKLMFYFLAILCGAILAVMIQWNGDLSAQVGAYHAALYIHIVGAVFAAFVLCTRTRKGNMQRTSLWMYLGGAIGVLTTLFNNFAFSRISLTSIVALGLFAQLVFSYFIDTFGWFGMERRREKLSICGTLLSVAGIALMLENPAAGGWGSVLISLGAGITVVLSRIVNAHLSQRIGALQGSLVNHLVGLPFCLLLAIGVGVNESSAAVPFMAGDFRLWIWCGGMLGVTTVAMTNVIVPKIPAYQLSLFLFCGQLFCGMLLDVFCGGALNKREFGAGILVAAGIAVNQVSKICRERKEKEEI